MSKSKNLFKKLSKSKNMVGLDFFTTGARLIFTKLKQEFIKALILHHFDRKRHIRIETDILGHAISGILTQVTLHDFG